MAKAATERLSTSPIACRMRAPRCTARGFCSKAAISRTPTFAKAWWPQRASVAAAAGNLPPRANQDCQGAAVGFQSRKALSKKPRKIKA